MGHVAYLVLIPDLVPVFCDGTFESLVEAPGSRALPNLRGAHRAQS